MTTKEQKTYMVKVERDDDGKWGYEKTFDLFITTEKEHAFNRVIEELKIIVSTIRGRTCYTEKIVKWINKLLNLIGSEEKSYFSLDGDTYYDKESFDIFHSFDMGNASFSIEIVEAVTMEDRSGLSITESQ